MKTMVKQRWDQCVVPCDVALCVFAEAVLEDDGTPGLGVTREPGVERRPEGRGMAWWVGMEEEVVAPEGRMEKGGIMVVWVGTRW